MTADLLPTGQKPASVGSTPPAVSGSGGEKLWALRRRRVPAPVETKCRIDTVAADTKLVHHSPCKVNRNLALGFHSRQSPARNEDVIHGTATSSKQSVENIWQLLNRFDRADASSSRWTRMVGTFQRANHLMEAIHKVSSAEALQQGRGDDMHMSTSLRDVLVLIETSLEALLLRLDEPLVDPAIARSLSTPQISACIDQDRHHGSQGKPSDQFMSDPWDECEDIAAEDLFEFFTDSLDARASTKNEISETAVEDLLTVCWQQVDLRKSGIKDDFNGTRTPPVLPPARPLSRLVDLKLPCDGAMGKRASDYCTPDKRCSRGDCTPDIRCSVGTASTVSRLSSRSSGVSSLSTARSSSGVSSISTSRLSSVSTQSSLASLPSRRSCCTLTPPLRTDASAPDLLRSTGRLRHVVEIASPSRA